MRDQFPGWYRRTPEELSALWERALFVPDANVLLHCLRHGAQVRGELLRVLELMRDSLWIPYQVGLEFHRNRLDVEFGANDAYDRLVSDYEAALGQAREKLRQMRAHPVINMELESAALETFLTDFKGRIAAAKAMHPSEALSQAVDRLTAIFEGRVGEPWPKEKLDALKKEGEDRYSRKVPPGYKDAKKDAGDLDKFGDLIIWKDLIAKAKSEGRPVIFISDDVKEDWWRTHKGRKLGPRPELVEEFRREGGQDFHLYEFLNFLRLAAERYTEIPAESIAQIERSLQDDEEARRRIRDAAEAEAKRAEIIALESERDALIGALSGVPGADAGPQADRADRVALRDRLRRVDAALDEARNFEGVDEEVSLGEAISDDAT